MALATACSSSSGKSTGTQTATLNAPPLLLQDCDPIVPSHCGLPFPSNVWTMPDSTRETGMHLYFGDTTLPTYDAKGDHVDKTPFIQRDGFSPGGALMTNLPGATITGLADAYHIEQSITPTSPTVIMEADTGAIVPHWAELDSLTSTMSYDSNNDVDAQMFFIRPALRLKDNTRYIVAIRNVVDDNGVPLPPSPVFQALRDNTPSSDLSVAPRRALYADILGKLQGAGIDPTSLQLAWDFTTASKDDTTQWMVHMRDDALNTVGAAGPAYTYTQCTSTPSGPSNAPCGITDNPNPYIRRRIIGQMTVPLYLDTPNPGASLNFGPGGRDTGMPTQNGTAVFQFLLQIPNSLVNSGSKGPIIQNAHGLFGDQTEGQDSYMAETCDREGYVEIAVDLVGMASDDGATYVPNLIAGDISQFYHVIDRMHQGFINELLVMRMMRGKMATDPATMFNGNPTINPTTSYYRGDSQGGISGGVYMAISTDVTRGLLGETGAPYNTLLDRSVDFNGFFLIIQGAYPNPLDIQFGLGLIQALWDRAEPGGYVSYISQDLPAQHARAQHPHPRRHRRPAGDAPRRALHRAHRRSAEPQPDQPRALRHPRRDERVLGQRDVRVELRPPGVAVAGAPGRPADLAGRSARHAPAAGRRAGHVRRLLPDRHDHADVPRRRPVRRAHGMAERRRPAARHRARRRRVRRGGHLRQLLGRRRRAVALRDVRPFRRREAHAPLAASGGVRGALVDAPRLHRAKAPEDRGGRRPLAPVAGEPLEGPEARLGAELPAHDGEVHAVVVAHGVFSMQASTARRTATSSKGSL